LTGSAAKQYDNSLFSKSINTGYIVPVEHRRKRAPGKVVVSIRAGRRKLCAKRGRVREISVYAKK